jgi:homoserine kinase type II
MVEQRSPKPLAGVRFPPALHQRIEPRFDCNFNIIFIIFIKLNAIIFVMSLTTNISDLDILKVSAKSFGILSSINVQKVGGNANKNYLIKSDDKEYIFKIILEHPDENIHRELVFLERLLTAGIPTIKYLRDNKGEIIHKEGDVIVVAMDKVDGEHPDLNIETAKLIGEQFANIHMVSIEGLPSRESWLSSNYLLDTLEKIETKFPEKAKKLKKQLIFLKDFNPEKFPQSIVHGDMSSSNCLVKDNKISVLLDWEEVGISAAILDLATCILNFCFEEDVFQEEYFRVMLNSYRGKRQLSKDELANLENALKYVSLTLFVWYIVQFGIKYPNEEKMKRFDGFLDKRINLPID